MKAQKINTQNYFETIGEIGFENLPLVLKQSHMVITAKTDNGSNWSKYQRDADLKRMINLAFKKLEEFLSSQQTTNKKGKREQKGLNGTTNYLTPKDVAIKLVEPCFLKADTTPLMPGSRYAIRNDDYAAHVEKDNVVVTMLYGTEIHETFKTKDILKEVTTNYLRKKSESDSKIKPRKKRATYHHKQPEFRILKAMLNWHNHHVTKGMVEWFIDELQGYIRKGEVTKESPAAKEIEMIQEKLVSIYNDMGSSVRVMLSDETRKLFKKALERVTDVEAKKTKPRNKGNEDNLSGIEEQTEEQANEDELQKPEATQLSENENKDSASSQINIMQSTDFANLHFNSIGFKDKWLTFIGDPAPGFTAMVFGMPKMGKSYLCLDFAGYLARHHGKVLYVAKEEKLDATLQKKLKDKNVAHENLTVADGIPGDLTEYDYIFLDSVNKLDLSAKDLEKLKANNKGKSFIYIFQATKTGKFRGNNEFQHDVDVVIEVPEKGKAVQYGRFNQGGEMNIFPKQENEEKTLADNLPVKESVAMLDGIKETNMKRKKSKTTKMDLEKYADRKDDFNPRYLFSLTATQLLCECLSGEIDMNYLVRRELANRGVNENGTWVGFPKAKEIHNV